MVSSFIYTTGVFKLVSKRPRRPIIATIPRCNQMANLANGHIKSIFGSLILLLIFSALFPTIFNSTAAISSNSTYGGMVTVLVPLLAVGVVIGVLYTVLKDAGVL